MKFILVTLLCTMNISVMLSQSIFDMTSNYGNKPLQDSEIHDATIITYEQHYKLAEENPADTLLTMDGEEHKYFMISTTESTWEENSKNTMQITNILEKNSSSDIRLYNDKGYVIMKKTETDDPSMAIMLNETSFFEYDNQNRVIAVRLNKQSSSDTIDMMTIEYDDKKLPKLLKLDGGMMTIAMERKVKKDTFKYDLEIEVSEEMIQMIIKMEGEMSQEDAKEKVRKQMGGSKEYLNIIPSDKGFVEEHWKSDREGKLNLKSKMTLNGEGRPLTKETADYSGSIDKEYFTYDKEGNIATYTSDDLNGKVYKAQKNNKGRLTVELTTDQMFKYEYDDQGRIKVKSTYNIGPYANDRPMRMEVYKYK